MFLRKITQFVPFFTCPWHFLMGTNVWPQCIWGSTGLLASASHPKTHPIQCTTLGSEWMTTETFNRISQRIYKNLNSVDTSWDGFRFMGPPQIIQTPQLVEGTNLSRLAHLGSATIESRQIWSRSRSIFLRRSLPGFDRTASVWIDIKIWSRPWPKMFFVLNSTFINEHLLVPAPDSWMETVPLGNQDFILLEIHLPLFVILGQALPVRYLFLGRRKWFLPIHFKKVTVESATKFLKIAAMKTVKSHRLNVQKKHSVFLVNVLHFGICTSAFVAVIFTNYSHKFILLSRMWLWKYGG